MKYSITKNDVGTTVIETFENENVIITKFANGETLTEFKPNCDKKIIDMYFELHRPLKREN